ncbi:FMN reductase [Xaviernesmea oryzae]|uniref:FMN reductase n=1 Tax=Xaviernesmea oryzae TaxID=464029 RepID=A0A1Q9B1G3_9HYPH|nr:NADPH-dependent FMN reductase [Xaviernesmea oryzae]OLP61838.1 FMN reductase [Xaviernesmea oryzae]SEL75916.1 NAD(P)H-dependent FMN reductase [Xaviernesmea oryzae]
MKLLAISGSARRLSTNTALLVALQGVAPGHITLDVFDGIGDLPVFSADLEGPARPASVDDFMQRIAESDGLLICSPEYIRGIPGGLKNAIDWLVSGEQIVGKPIALVHASHRGDDMLAALRLVLSTVSVNFNETLFFRLPVMQQTPEAIRARVQAPDQRPVAEQFLEAFSSFCRIGGHDGPAAIKL